MEKSIEEFEIVWNGAKCRNGSHTKGELLGEYSTIPITSITHVALPKKIHAKIVKRQEGDENE